MDCERFEPRILEYLESQLPPTERARVAAHLAGCAACRTLAQQLEQLDAHLARTLKSPMLSTSFNSRLQQRLQATRPLGEAERLERKRRLQAEYEAGLLRLSPFHLPRRRLLPTLGYSLILASVGWLVWQVLPQFASLLARLFQTGLNQNLVMAFTVGAIFVAMGFAAAAFSRHLRRIMSVSVIRG